MGPRGHIRRRRGPLLEALLCVNSITELIYLLIKIISCRNNRPRQLQGRLRATDSKRWSFRIGDRPLAPRPRLRGRHWPRSRGNGRGLYWRQRLSPQGEGLRHYHGNRCQADVESKDWRRFSQLSNSRRVQSETRARGVAARGQDRHHASLQCRGSRDWY